MFHHNHHNHDARWANTASHNSGSTQPSTHGVTLLLSHTFITLYWNSCLHWLPIFHFPHPLKLSTQIFVLYLLLSVSLCYCHVRWYCHILCSFVLSYYVACVSQSVALLRSAVLSIVCTQTVAVLCQCLIACIVSDVRRNTLLLLYAPCVSKWTTTYEQPQPPHYKCL
jgi:hypothetical protein